MLRARQLSCRTRLALPRAPVTLRVRLVATSTPDKKDDKKDEPPKPSRWQQIKTTVREYGPVFVGYYVTTYAAGFGVCWSSVTIAGLDGVALLQYFGVDQVLDTSMFSPRVINALIAAEMNEMLEFVRLPFIIATTPALSRRLRGTPAPVEETPPESPPSNNKKTLPTKASKKGR